MSAQPSADDLTAFANLADAEAPAEPTDAKPLLTLTLTTLTPLFLGGAAKQAEARAASLRGALRWWLRALLGGVLSTAYPAPVARACRTAELEAELLGQTDYASPFQLQLSVVGKRIAKESPLSNRDQDEYGQDAYGQYMYVAFPFVKNRQWTRSFWRDGSTITVRLSGAGISADDPRALALAGVLWTWATLGTLGARGRRGFGAMHLREADGPLSDADGAAGWQPPDTAERWQSYLQEGLDRAGKALADLAGVPFSSLAERSAKQPGAFTDPLPAVSAVPAWSSFAAGHWRLLVVGPPGVNDRPAWWQWNDALSALGRAIRAFREDTSSTPRQRGQARFHTTHDYPRVAGFLRLTAGGSPVDFLNDEFGSPWNWSCSASRPRTKGPRASRMVQLTAAVEPFSSTSGKALTMVGRRASPLLARPLVLTWDQSRNGWKLPRFGIVFLAFRSQFLPPGVDLRLVHGFWSAVPADREPGAPPPQQVVLPPADLPQLRAFMDDVTGKTRVLVDLPR